MIDALRAMPRGRQRAVLRLLSAQERDRVLQLLDESEAGVVPRSTEDGAVPPRFSVWLEMRLAPGGGVGSRHMTGTALDALRGAAREIEGAEVRPIVAQARGRSLLTRLSELSRRPRTAS